MKMTRQYLTVISLAALTLLAGCKEKKTTTDIIAEPAVVTQPSGPTKMQTYNDQREVKWLGKTYSVEIDRHPSDSLPMVTDETGQKFVDNVIRLTVRRPDGSVAISKKFLKTTFDRWLNGDYREHSILEGFVFDAVDDHRLQFAASVCLPQTDEYVPMVVTVDNLSNVDIRLDTDLDTHGARDEEE